MKKWLIAPLALAFCWSLSLATISTTGTDWDNSIVVPAGADTTGGPDAFGYTWKDSMEPTGPRYRWQDISAAGTIVTGLGDDNFVGPFPIGFQFQYYWYPVTQFWIGSNGYLKFGSGALIASPFPASIPLPAAPNDFMGVYMADWVLGGATAPDTCIRWSNNVDTCIVSWINVEAWLPAGNAGSHSFQVILVKTDSSITYQIGPQQGEVYSASGSWSLSGIECISGQVGLQRSANMLLPASYAVKFYYPDEITFQVHDLAALAVDNPNSEGFFLQPGDTYTGWALVKNAGNQTETSYSVNFRIQQISGPMVYNQDVTGGTIVPGEVDTVTYAATWTPSAAGQYSVRAGVTLVGEMNPNNDVKLTECWVVSLPGWLTYEDGTAEGSLSWQGGGGGDEGGATRFEPPTYPVQIDCLRVYPTTAGQQYKAQVRDDDGPNGIPGTVLYEITTTPTAVGWNNIGLGGQAVQIDDGAFYVVWLMMGTTASIGQDTTGSRGSRQAWEYTGVWSPYRDAETSDFLLRAKVSEVGAPNEPPEIVEYSPTELDTVTLASVVEFWVSATDPNGDPLSYTWQLDGELQGTDSTVTIVFDSLGVHEVWVWVFDGELADSMNWVATVVPVGVIGETDLLPTEYVLNEIYPNPFNPTTTVSFSLPKAGDVRLAVFDQTGREVAKLVSGWRPAGTHQAVFNATGLSSGVYIVRLDAGTFSASEKVVLMK